MKNLETIILTKQDLKEAVAENKFWGNTYQPPFSLNKAKWLLKNERAEDNDVFAILGYENYDIIAFVYLIPDLIRVKGGKVKKVYWSQKWWVSDKYVKTVLSTYVKKLSLEACKNQVVIRFLDDNSKPYYSKQPFTEFSIRERYLVIFSFNYDLLVYKKSSLKKIGFILKIADRLSRNLVAFINYKVKIKISKDVSFENLTVLNNETWDFLELHCQNDIVPKSKAYINWQIDNNQYHLITKDSGQPNYECLLKSISRKIYNVSYSVKKSNKVIGFISGFVSKNTFIIRYFVTTKENYNYCLNVLVKIFMDYECTLFQTEDGVLGARIKAKFFNIYADDKELVSLIHNDVDLCTEGVFAKNQDGNYY